MEQLDNKGVTTNTEEGDSQKQLLYSSVCTGPYSDSGLGGSWQAAGVVNSIKYSQRLGSDVDFTAVSFPQINVTWKTGAL